MKADITPAHIPEPGTAAPVHVVLVETSHPGNIGAAARAMKTMGLSSLRLVKPASFPGAEATARASGADDLLERAEVFDSLEAAIADCAGVMALSARQRGIPWPVLDPRECADAVVGAADATALVFGREKWGLSNDELSLANYLVQIPANPAYSSLNLAMAVQVVTFEIMMARRAAAGNPPAPRADRTPPATADEMAHFYTHLETVALESGFLDPRNPKHLMRRFRRLFNRAALDQNEVNIMRGLMSAFQGIKRRRDDDGPGGADDDQR